MANRFHQPTVNPFTPPAPLLVLRRMIFERNLRSSTLAALVTIDETLREFYRLQGASPTHKLRYAAEPADLLFTLTKEEARRRLDVPPVGRYVLFYGNVHMRKGLAEVITAIASIAPELNTRLLLVGPQDPAERDYIAHYGARLRETGRLFEFDRFVSPEEESVAFSAADILWLGYSRHYSPSSVQGKGCNAGCAIVSCREGNLGWTTKRYGLGLAINVHDPAAVKEALEQLLQSRDDVLDQYKQNCRKYVRGRTAGDFGHAIISMAEESVAAGARAHRSRIGQNSFMNPVK